MTISVPAEIVEAYNAANISYISDEEFNGRWSRRVLEDMKDVLHLLVQASSNSEPHVAVERHMGKALSILKNIPHIWDRDQVIVPAALPNEEVVLPQEYVDLHSQTHVSYLRYADIMGKKINRGLIFRFRHSLSHIIDIAENPSLVNEHSTLLAQAIEHLTEIAAESTHLAARRVLNRNVAPWKLGVVRIPFTPWKLIAQRVFRTGVPGPNQIKDRIRAVSSDIATGRALKGKVRHWKECLAYFESALEKSVTLEEQIRGGSIRTWAIVVPLILAVLGIGMTLYFR